MAGGLGIAGDEELFKEEDLITKSDRSVSLTQQQVNAISNNIRIHVVQRVRILWYGGLLSCQTKFPTICNVLLMTCTF